MNYATPEIEQFSGTRFDPDARLWEAFAAADSAEALYRSWLNLQCRNLPGVSGAMLLLTRDGGPFQPVAVWPDAAHDFSFLRPVAEKCVKTGAPVVHRNDAGTTGLHVAYPFLADADQPVGVVVLDLLPRSDTEIKTTLRDLHWGVGWLEARAVRDRMSRERQRVAGAAAALDIVAVANGHDRIEAAAMAVANELASRMGASRVAIGLDSGNGTRLAALSHTAWFKRKTPMVAAIERAMDEATGQRATIRVPPAEGDAARIQTAHEALTAHWNADGAYATFPLTADRGPAGAVTLLYEEPPPDSVVRLGEAICALLGPILDQKRRARHLVSGRLADSTRDALAAIIGPRHIAWKLAAVVAASAVVAAIVIPAQFRVSAKAVLEGRVQRAVTTPFEGFLATGPARAGDLVRAGDLLATMDDRDLLLERVRWHSEHERLILKSREALAKHDPSASGQFDAQLRQTDAQEELTAEKLARTRIVAPIDGIVVSGDMSQSIGAPVETGKVLFEIAPLDDYRVIVRLDERDVRYVRPGQTGFVLLHGATGDHVAFTVRSVTSVAESDAGHNSFRVEGSLDGNPANLRPGMEGVGKIDIAEHSYAWIWTRSLIDWARMLIWSWTP